MKSEYFHDRLDHVVDVPAAPHALTSGGPSDELLVEFVPPGRLSVSVARNAWPVEFAYDHWMEFDRPSFNWEAIASFRSDDPIMLVHIGVAVQAMMQLKEECIVPCPLGARNALTYVSFLEVAPWNRNGIARRRLKGLGQLMLRFASQRSRQLGWAGRIGLHALPNAEAFYAQLGFVAANCPNEYHERYFELSPESAATFLTED